MSNSIENNQINEIVNKDTILNEIDKALGKKSNPSVEYLITKPYGLFKLPFGLGSVSWNWFGHSALRYTTPDGIDVVVNVEAKEKNKNFIQIYDAKEYLFGIDIKKGGAQRGIYQRDIIGLRVENVNPENIKKLHQIVNELKSGNNDQYDNFRFNIILGPILNFFGQIFGNFPQYGNCSRWTSLILNQAGLTTKIFVWPKTLFIDMFENYDKTNIKEQSNMNIIYYEQPSNISKPFYGVSEKPVWFEKSVAPFQSLRNYFYGDLKHFAKIIVKVDTQTNYAKLIINPDNDISKPNKIRNMLNSKYFILTSIVTSIIIYKKGFTMSKTFIKKNFFIK
jgi:hypothetical protein